MNTNYQLQTLPNTSVIQDNQIVSASNQLAELSFAAAESIAFSDRLNAGLIKQAMDNTAALAALEGYYNQIAPSGQEEFRLIVQTYARLALAQIVGGNF